MTTSDNDRDRTRANLTHHAQALVQRLKEAELATADLIRRTREAREEAHQVMGHLMLLGLDLPPVELEPGEFKPFDPADWTPR